MNKPAIIGALIAVAAIAGGFAAVQHREIATPEPVEQTATTTPTAEATPALPRDVPATAEPAASAQAPDASATTEPAAPEAKPKAEGDSNPTPANVAQSNRDAVLSVTPGDIVIGQADAPKTIFEYASLSCSHCATFHTTILPELKKNLIESGKVKLVFRHYPLNKPAMDGALLVECAEGPLKAKLLQVLFENQNKWAFTAESPAILKNMALLAGIDAKRFETCLNDKAMQDRILQGVQTATKVLEISSTPSLFVNGRKFEEAPTPTGLAKALGE